MGIARKASRLAIAAAALVGVVAMGGASKPADAAGAAAYREQMKWSWTGPFGTFDRAAAQRGMQVNRS